jgi:hypothetical protein
MIRRGGASGGRTSGGDVTEKMELVRWWCTRRERVRRRERGREREGKRGEEEEDGEGEGEQH